MSEGLIALTRRTWDDLKKLKSRVDLLSKQALTAVTPPRVRPYRYDHFRNMATEEMPAYGVFRAEDTVDLLRCVEAHKPSTTFGRSYFLNGHLPIKKDKTGTIQTGDLLIAKYDTGTPAFGETWGMKPSQWTVSKNYPGFTCQGVFDEEMKLMLAVPSEPPFYLCKADSNIAKGAISSSGAVSLYTMSAANEDMGVNVTAKALVGAITADKWCQFVPFKTATYDGLIYPGECS